MTRAKAPKIRRAASQRKSVRAPSRRQIEDAEDLKAAKRARRERGAIPIEQILRRLAD